MRIRVYLRAAAKVPEVNFNNRLRTQSPRVTAGRVVLTTVSKHAPLPFIPPCSKYLAAMRAVKETSGGVENENCENAPNKYEVAFLPRSRAAVLLVGTSVLH